jgi:[ribosomal protein S5]-alanine N-acetyltransferase
MALPLDFQLATTRCILRAPSERDIPHILAATRFDGFNEGMSWDPPSSEVELLAPLQRNLEAWKEGRDYSFTIEGKEGSDFFGRIAIRRTPQPRLWNIGFWLHPVHQGKGLMTEAARAVVALGFSQLEAEAIEARHAVWNVKSRRVLERLGMNEVEFVAQGFKKRGEWVKEFRMLVEKKTWKEPNPSPESVVSSGTPRAGREPRHP